MIMDTTSALNKVILLLRKKNMYVDTVYSYYCASFIILEQIIDQQCTEKRFQGHMKAGNGSRNGNGHYCTIVFNPHPNYLFWCRAEAKHSLLLVP